MADTSKPKENAKSKKGRNSSKNSSKTSRVLGLLTTQLPAQPSAEEPGGGEPVQPQPSAPVDPKFSSDEVVEAQIRSALEELVDEPAAHVPKPEPELEGKPEPQAEAEPEPQPEPEPVLEPQPDPEPEEEEEEEEEPELPPMETPGTNPKEVVEEGEKPGEEIICFNVMQALVKAKADKYMKMFGLCTCPRCRTDVMALSLTRLPPKYIVAKGHELVPLLSVYEGQFNTAVVSQVINACKMVMEHPRHDKK